MVGIETDIILREFVANVWRYHSRVYNFVLLFIFMSACVVKDFLQPTHINLFLTSYCLHEYVI